MTGELPQGWAVAKLKDLVGPDGIFTDGDWILSEHLRTGNDVRLIQLADVGIGQFLDKSQKFISGETAKALGVTYLQECDVLISRMADPLARACLFPKFEKPAITAVDVAIARCDGSTSVPAYLMYLCNSYRVLVQAEEVAVGTTRKRISRKNLEQIRVPLAPLVEQRCIVAKLELLFSQVDACRNRLDKIPTLLKRFRQSVLADACSGRLTEDWREEHVGEDADLLVATLASQRQNFWERREAARMKAVGKSVDDDKWKRYYKTPFAPSDDFQADLPMTWSTATVSQVAFLDVGFAFKSSEFSDEGIRLLRGENLEPGKLRWSDTRYWPKEKLQGLDHLLIEEGEIILALDRPVISTGLKIARATKSDLPCLLVQRMMRFKMVEPRITDWLFCNLNLPAFIRHLSAGLTGSDLPHVTGTGVAEYTFGLPPLAEQEEIVLRVERLFALADNIEQRYKKAQAFIDKLTPSLLAKAFRGELVPQDLNDEQASVLLERIKAEKEQKKPQDRKKR